MREIKFRAWDKADKCMNNVLTMEFDNKELIKVGYTFDGTDDPDNGCLRYPSMIELMQYIGLKDKNGVEIYEGDIIKVLVRDWPSCSGCHETSKEHMDSIALRMFVTFSGFEFIMKKEHAGGGQYHQRFDYGGEKDIFEVIGNIYENGDLLDHNTNLNNKQPIKEEES